MKASSCNPWGKYVSLPSTIPPKYLISLENRRVFLAGFGFYNALTWRSKIKKKLAEKSYSLFTLKNRLLGDTLSSDSKLLRVKCFIESMESTGKAFNFYVPSYNKVVVQILNYDGECQKILKIALNEQGERELKIELRNLHYLERFSFKHFEIPKIVKKGFKEGLFYSELTCPCRSKPLEKLNLSNEIMLILIELMTVNISQEIRIVDTALFRNIKTRINVSPDGKVKEFLQKTINLYMNNWNHIKIPTGIVHNDFKPWNMLVKSSNNKIFLVDWELMLEYGLPLWDLYSYVIFTYITLKYDVVPQEIMRIFEKRRILFVEYAEEVGIDVVLVEKLVPLYLSDIISKVGIWERWEIGEDRPKRILTSMVVLLEYMFNNQKKCFGEVAID